MTRSVTVIVEGKEYIVEVGDLGERPIKATVNQRTYQVEVSDQAAQQPAPGPLQPAATPQPVAAPAIPTPTGAPVGGKMITAPMPGDILAVEVQVGSNVCAGDVICVLEAMKMKNMIRSPRAGIIKSVEVTPGQAVDYGAALVTFE